MGRKGKSPPFLSQDFIIQNHGDIVSCMCMVVMVGLMFKTTQPLAQLFIAAQHNITTVVEAGDNIVNYGCGVKDLCTIFFYTLCWIVCHAIIQEFILDKFNKRLHMSKTKHSKFNDSGNMLPFFIASIGFAIDQIQKLGILPQFSSLWEKYPQVEMTFMVKYYFILQIGFWLHCYPELFFMKARKEDLSNKVTNYTLYLLFISAAYMMSGTHIALIFLTIHYIPEAVFHATRLVHCAGKTDISQHGFNLWAIAFVLARVLTISLTILIVWFGLGTFEIAKVNIASGNFNTPIIRVAWCAAVILVQAWMAWNFIMFQVRRYRESTPHRTPKSDKGDKKKKKTANGSSPRAKKTTKQE